MYLYNYYARIIAPIVRKYKITITFKFRQYIYLSINLNKLVFLPQLFPHFEEFAKRIEKNIIDYQLKTRFNHIVNN